MFLLPNPQAESIHLVLGHTNATKKKRGNATEINIPRMKRVNDSIPAAATPPMQVWLRARIHSKNSKLRRHARSWSCPSCRMKYVLFELPHSKCCNVTACRKAKAINHIYCQSPKQSQYIECRVPRTRRRKACQRLQRHIPWMKRESDSTKTAAAPPIQVWLRARVHSKKIQAESSRSFVILAVLSNEIRRSFCASSFRCGNVTARRKATDANVEVAANTQTTC